MEAVKIQDGVSCQTCESRGPHVEVPETNGVHHARLVCGNCHKFIRWVPKPKTDKRKRPTAHGDLVHKYSTGICEMCHTLEDELFKGDTLEAHHVKEYIDEGSNTRENIWIVCTTCHDEIDRRRRQTKRIREYTAWQIARNSQ